MSAQEEDRTPFICKGYYLDTVVRNMLRLHFSRSPLQNFPGLENVVWQPDVRAGALDSTPKSIRIDVADAWTPDRTGGYPAIMVRSGDLGSAKIGIGNRHMSPNPGNLQGTRHYTVPWAGSLLIYCLATKQRQAYLIALSCANYLQSFSDQIRGGLCLSAFQAGRVGAPKPLREMPSILASPVTVEYGFFETWSVTPAAPVLQKIQPTVRVS